MKIFSQIRAGWKAASTADKVHIILDILCGMGTGILIYDVTAMLAPGHNKLEKALITITTSGLGLAAGNVAANTLHESYGVVLANAIDRAKDTSKKEEQKNA